MSLKETNDRLEPSFFSRLESSLHCLTISQRNATSSVVAVALAVVAVVAVAVALAVVAVVVVWFQ